MSVTRIFLDLDGTVCDFVTDCLKLHDTPLTHDDIHSYYMEQQLGITVTEFWEKIDACPTFWDDLPAYDWARGFYYACLAYAPVTISTSPSFDHGCWSAKVRWCRRHLNPSLCGKSIMMGSAKELLAAPGRVLIDDSDTNCERFAAAGGHAILFPRPWNENRAFSADPISYVLGELDCLSAPESVAA